MFAGVWCSAVAQSQSKGSIHSHMLCIQARHPLPAIHRLVANKQAAAVLLQRVRRNRQTIADSSLHPDPSSGRRRMWD